jgi:hypothetical protein
MNMNFFSAQSRATTSMARNERPFAMGMFPRRNVPMESRNTDTVVPTPPNVNKVRWGEPTWFLFHTLSEKIKESEFPRLRQELLNHIYAICVNLPCPICAEHAKTYLDGINFNTIQTKEDLQKMMYAFHNSVNERKGYPVFPYNELSSKYSLAITTNIIHNFMSHYSEKSRNPKMLAGDFLRNRLIGILKKWFSENIQAFV